MAALRAYPLEKTVQKDIIHALTKAKVFHWRNNTGAYRTPYGMYTFGAVGSADIIACKNGQLIGIEVKTKVGRLSPSQKAWGSQLQEAGGKYIVARCVDDIQEIL